MDSEERCNTFKIVERPDFIIPHKCYSGELPIEVIISDLKYIKLSIDYSVIKLTKDENAFNKIIENVINKPQDDNYFCKYYYCDFGLIEGVKKIYMLLTILDHIVNKISSNKFFRSLKEELEEELKLRVHYPSVEDPVYNSS